MSTQKSISRAKSRAFAFIPRANGPRVPPGTLFPGRFERERTQDHPIGTSDIAQQAGWSGRFRSNCLNSDQWLILCLSFRSLQDRIRHLAARVCAASSVAGRRRSIATPLVSVRRRSDDTSDDTDAFSNSAKLARVTFDWDHAIFGNPVLYNTDRFQKSNDLYWLRLQVYF